MRSLFYQYRAFLKNLSIRNKIIALYMPLIILPLLLLGIFSNMIYTRTVVEKTVKNVSDNMELMVTGIDKILTNTENCANILILNLNRVLAGVENAGDDLITDLQMDREINNQLSFGLVLFPEVESATFIRVEDMKVYSSNRKLVDGISRLQNYDIMDMLSKEEGNKNIWFPMRKRDILEGEENAVFLPFGKVVNDISSFDKVGYLLLFIKESQFSSLFTNIAPTKNGQYFIADQQGYIVSSIHKEELLKPVQDTAFHQIIQKGESRTDIEKIGGRNYLVIIKPFERTGWRMVCRIPVDELTRENRQITLLILLIGFVCLIFALIGSTLLSNVISKPIASLAGHMLKSRDGIPDPYKGPDTGEEIGQLSSAFNTMIARNKNLMARVEEEERKKREFELSLIQMQIKPHFLYNTLDVICALAEMGREKEVIKASRSLANFYKAVLSKGKEIITVGEEIENVINYLCIQHIRYSDVFDYKIAVENSIKSCIILKLTIQPLVENAIYHGLKPKGRPGIIKIDGFRSGNKIIIKISDDGVGIPKGKLDSLLGKKSAGRTNGSFGINNVDERIKLFFGGEYGLRFDSIEGNGTTVTVEIPATDTRSMSDAENTDCR